jgi:hypothetical protein
MNPKTIAVLVVVGLLSMPGWCIADDGKKLLADCEAGINIADENVKSPDTSKSYGGGRCLGFLQGVIEMHEFYRVDRPKGDSLFCPPDDATYVQYARIVVKYLRDHPEELHKDDFVLAVKALVVAFPCTNKK